MNKKFLLVNITLLCFMTSFLMLLICNPFVLGSIGSFQVVKTITVNENVNSLAVNEEMSRLYVGTENGLSIFNSETDTKITDILPGIEVSALALNPQSNRLYVVEWGEKVIVIDCTTNQQVGEIDEGIYDQREITVNPVTNRIYVAQWHTFKGDYCCVRVYNGDTLAFITQINICDGYHTYVERVGVTVNPETNIIYATWSGDDSIYVIDGNTNEIKESFTPSSFSVEVAVIPQTKRIYVGDVVLDCVTFQEVTTKYSGNFMAIDPVNNLLFTTGYSEVYVLNATTHGTIVSLELPEEGYFNPDSAAMNSKNGKFYTAYSGDSKIHVVMQVESESQPPIASFTSSPSSPEEGTTINFDASGSSDPDGIILTYSWNFGDGTTESGAAASHSFASAGTYIVTLTVKDNDGLTGIHTQNIIVSPSSPTLEAPIAYFIFSPSSSKAGETVNFDASGSYDPDDGIIASYSWDFGEGNTGTGMTASHSYSSDGVFIITLSVTDNDSLTDTLQKTITITSVEPIEPEPTEPTEPEPTEPTPTEPESTTPEPTAPEPSTSEPTAQAYTNEENNFSINPPSSWTVDDKKTGAEVYFYGPTDEGFMVNINIQVESLPTTMTLEQYVSASKNALQSGLDNYKLITESARVINKVDAYELVSTFTYSNVDIKNKQVALVNANKGYVITYSALPTTYQKYLPTFESSIQTFKFIEPEPTTSEPEEPQAAEEITFPFNLSLEILLVVVVIVVVTVALVAYKLGKRKAGTQQ